LIYLKKGAEIYPRGVQIHYNIGLVLYKIERFEEALESYKRVVALNPNYTSAHHNMGVIYCKKALELDPKKVSSYYTLARSLEKLGKF
jgi:superkiller protein 3